MTVSIHCLNVSIENVPTCVKLILFSGLILLTAVNGWSEEGKTKTQHKLYAEVGLDVGLPFGLPGFHLEMGHPNLAALMGVGLSCQCMINRSLLHLDKPCPAVFSFGLVASPVPSRWVVRPRVMVLYTNESVYVNHRGRRYTTGEWKTFHEERFPGLCVLLELEINPKKLGLAAYEGKPNARIQLGFGSNKPFAGWDTIDKLDDKVLEQINREPYYYAPTASVNGKEFHWNRSVRIALSWRFGI